MPKLTWDDTGKRSYETGVQNGVLYLIDEDGKYSNGVAWNGLIGITESPSGAEPNPKYADNIKYLNMISKEEFAATIEAYTYPDEFAECDGSVSAKKGVMIGQQSRKTFGLCYKTLKGNDVDGNELGYKLHLIYGAVASPSDKAYETINDSPDAITFSWEITTTPVEVTDYKHTASITIDSTLVASSELTSLEEVLYGNETDGASLPLPDDIIEMFTDPVDDDPPAGGDDDPPTGGGE